MLCLHHVAVKGIEYPIIPRSLAGGSVVIGRISLVDKVKGEGPD